MVHSIFERFTSFLHRSLVPIQIYRRICCISTDRTAAIVSLRAREMVRLFAECHLPRSHDHYSSDHQQLCQCWYRKCVDELVWEPPNEVKNQWIVQRTSESRKELAKHQRTNLFSLALRVHRILVRFSSRALNIGISRVYVCFSSTVCLGIYFYIHKMLPAALQIIVKTVKW